MYAFLDDLGGSTRRRSKTLWATEPSSFPTAALEFLIILGEPKVDTLPLFDEIKTSRLIPQSHFRVKFPPPGCK